MPERVLGLLAEFGSEETVLEAAKRAEAEGFRRIDAFTPFPVEGMAEVLALKRDHRIGWITLGGGPFGFFGMLLVQLFVNWDYPIEVGNRPVVRLAGLLRRRFRADDPLRRAVRGRRHVRIIGLPKLYHPLFGAPRFALASDDRFFLYIDARDPKFDVKDPQLPRKARRLDGRAGAAMRAAAASSAHWRLPAATRISP